MKCVLKYGGGGIGGGASKAGGASLGLVLADNEDTGISVGKVALFGSICGGTPILRYVWTGLRLLTVCGMQRWMETRLQKR